MMTQASLGFIGTSTFTWPLPDCADIQNGDNLFPVMPKRTVGSHDHVYGFSDIFCRSVFLGALDFLRRSCDADGLSQYDNASYHAWMGLVFDVLSAVPFASLRQQNRPRLFLSLKLGSILINLILFFFSIELLPGLAEKGEYLAKNIHPEISFFMFSWKSFSKCDHFCCCPALMKAKRFKWDLSFLKRMLVYAWP
jgi:hypothetical protein